MNNKITGISVIIPTFNEASSISELIKNIDITIPPDIKREYILVDDNSTDNTQEVILSLQNAYSVSLHVKKGKRGKALSFKQGFLHAKYEYICTIDADLASHSVYISAMIVGIELGADVILANGIQKKIGVLEKFHHFIFNKYLHSFNFDVYSGLKLFKTEIIERINFKSHDCNFDLEFLHKAKNAGYKIVIYNGNKIVSTSQRINQFSIKKAIQRAIMAVSLKIFPSEVIPVLGANSKGNAFHFKGKKYVSYSDLPHKDSAIYTVTKSQIIIGYICIALFLIGIIINWKETFVFTIALLTLMYFSDLLFNLYLVQKSFKKKQDITILDREIRAVPDQEWPVYTVFCPLYKEYHVLPQFVDAMSKLDYPKDKLQIMLLLEENDIETIEHIKNYELPYYFDVVIVPHSLPKTKPKALNYGLQFARGEYVVIYDAEDIPDIRQLKKVICAFKKATADLACIQAKLNFYNPHQNFLTKLFTAEYSLWFELVLTGLQSINAPIPLGGTSNHFRIKDIIELKGWDSFNVTEDCDLGMRLVKKGYRTAIIDSVTLEEANSDVMNWFAQRSRWIKGYIQSYLQHMRNPGEFANSWKKPHLLTFQLVVGGKVLSMIINPLMWIITLSYFVLHIYVGEFIEEFFPTGVLYMAIISLVIGNFLYMYYYMIGCYRHGHFTLVKYMYLVPIYWLGMSIATWMAVHKFITDPYYWSKTKHGLHLQKESEVSPVTTPQTRTVLVNLSSNT